MDTAIRASPSVIFRNSAIVQCHVDLLDAAISVQQYVFHCIDQTCALPDAVPLEHWQSCESPASVSSELVTSSRSHGM